MCLAICTNIFLELIIVLYHFSHLSRHEIPEDKGDLAQQNIKDRYYGVNDPVANKLLRKVAQMPNLQPPADQEIKTLYLGNVTPQITEQDIQYALSRTSSLVSALPVFLVAVVR